MSALHPVRLENVSGEGDLSDASSREHWEEVWAKADPDRVSWYESRPGISLRLIDRSGMGPDTGVIDVGGGASLLVHELLAAGFTDLTVLEISERGIQAGRERLGPLASDVSWIRADVRALEPHRTWDVWHDRAVFHFLTAADDRAAYRQTLTDALAPGGQVVLATFGPGGPTRCSGLDVRRYSPESLSEELGSGFTLEEWTLELHSTPSGGVQEFLYGRFKRANP